MIRNPSKIATDNNDVPSYHMIDPAHEKLLDSDPMIIPWKVINCLFTTNYHIWYDHSVNDPLRRHSPKYWVGTVQITTVDGQCQCRVRSVSTGERSWMQGLSSSKVLKRWRLLMRITTSVGTKMDWRYSFKIWFPFIEYIYQKLRHISTNT